MGIRKTLLERFEEKYIPEPNTGCWLWTGAVDSRGRGRMARGPRDAGVATAASIGMELSGYPVPESSMVRNRCGEISCVNPDHHSVVSYDRSEFHSLYEVRDSGCWEWTGVLLPNGYGRIGGDKAHRLSYELHHGPIPEGMCVLHACDNPPCVNPAHLSVGTHADNQRDMVVKGRHALQKDASRMRGSRNHRARLSAEDVDRIRQLLAEKCGQVAIASWFGISQTHVSYIKLGKTWSHT